MADNVPTELRDCGACMHPACARCRDYGTARFERFIRDCERRNTPTTPPPAEDAVAALQHLETAVHAACNMLRTADLASTDAMNVAAKLAQLSFELEQAEARLRLRVLRSKRGGQ